MPAKDTYVSLDALKLKHRRWRHYDIRLFDRLSDITVVSPHGGYIEAGTSYLARQIAASDLNLFDFQGLLKTDPHASMSLSVKEPLLRASSVLGWLLQCIRWVLTVWERFGLVVKIRHW
jgi:phage replication-related protein YjqB (UPF0714/DUF867 family)